MLVNVEDDYESRQITTMYHSNQTTTNHHHRHHHHHPGIGSYTPYHGRRWKAKCNIPAGMELYGNYGQAYFTTRSDYDTVPLKQN